MNKKTWLLVLGVTFLLFSCKKQLLTFKSKERDSVKVEEINFDYFVTKTKIKYIEGDKRVNGTAHIRMKKDSIIWLSVSPSVGLEATRCIITKDTIIVLNRMEKEYYVFNFDEISKFFNFRIDFDLIQSILVGNLARPVDEDSKISRENKFFVIKQKSGHLEIQTFVNHLSKKIETVMMNESSTKNSMNLKYSDFKQLNNFIFPEVCQINLTYKAAKGPMMTSVSLQHNKAEISDKPLKFPFNIPSKYEAFK